MMIRRLIGYLGLVGCLLASEFGAAGQEPDVVQLFNGKDLTGFYTFLKGRGKNNDADRVIAVEEGMIRVSGKAYGGFITEKEFANYHLVVEFKWGDRTWAPREKGARDSGILLHCVGPEGVVDGSWMESIECQIIEGGTGDFILVKTKNPMKLTVTVDQRGYFMPGGTPREFTGGRINWFGRDKAWKNVKGFRGANDVEKPAGEWNRLECICDGDKITNILNGTVVNAGTNASHTRGKIMFQSEGAEIYFRKIELKTLK